MSKFKITILSILGLILTIALFLGLDYSGMLWNSFIGPKKENVRREIFEKTRSYNEAKLQELAKYKNQYELATEENKIIIEQTIKHMFANYDATKLPYQLKLFLEQRRGY